LPNRNSPLVNAISYNISNVASGLANDESIAHSYSPTINQDLVLLQSIDREYIPDCNNQLAFELKEPLQIHVKDKCVPYYDADAIKILLRNLSANKHIKPSKVVPPIQSLSNCWFNAMFVVLFVSDKGRKFFHYFRQLMIEGIQSNKKPIPSKLKNAFALLNFAIEACLTGNEFAYVLDTNAIIHSIYDTIPDSYKASLPYITDVNTAGNPIMYYRSIVNYLHNESLELMIVSKANQEWEQMVADQMRHVTHLPHCVIIEIFDLANKTSGASGNTRNKKQHFSVQNAKYALDSCVVRDISQQHFCALLTCENKQMAYDGMSYHRLVPLEWKNKINSDFVWSFEVFGLVGPLDLPFRLG
jgi:hypothetical protein